MLLTQELDHVREIAAGFRQTLLRPGLRFAPCVIGGQIRNIPTRNELSKRRHSWVLSELAESVDREQVGRFQRHFGSPVLRIGKFAAHSASMAFTIVQKLK